MKRLSILFVLLLAGVVQAQVPLPQINTGSLTISRSRFQVVGQPAVEYCNINGHYKMFDPFGGYVVWSWSPSGMAGTYVDLGFKYYPPTGNNWTVFAIDPLDHSESIPATNAKLWIKVQFWNTQGGTSPAQVRLVNPPG